MAIRFEEKPNSPEWVNGAAIKHYWLRGTSDDMLAIQYMLQHTPLIYEGLMRQANFSVVPEWNDTIEDDGFWNCDLQYGQFQAAEPQQDEIGTVVVLFDTGGGATQHIMRSIQTLGSYCTSPLETAIEFNRRIGVSPDRMHTEGIDIPIAMLALTVTKIWSKYDLPDPDTLLDLSHHVNSGWVTFVDTTTGQSWTFAPGELLFKYVTNGRLREDDGVEYTYYFEARRNRSNVTIGSILVESLPGNAAYWVYEMMLTDDQNRHTIEAVQVNVEQVLYEGNLNLLGL